MKKLLRMFIGGSLLVSSLVLLTGCDFFKQASCPTCKPQEPTAPVSPEDVLLSIDGEPAITKEQFETFYEVAQANAGPYGAGALSKRDAFNMMVNMEVLNRKIIKDLKDQSAEYKKEFIRAYNMARWGVNTQICAHEIQETIDISDKAVEKFYKEQIGTNRDFNVAPFLKNPESIKIRSIEFTSKPDAEAFLAKAKTDFDGAAATAGLTIKDLGNVSDQSKDIDFSIKLKARTLEPNTVELVQAGDKTFVIKSGAKTKAQYADFSEIKAMPKMKEQLAGYKKQMELEPAFIKRIEDYKKEFTLDENPQYFEEDEAQRKAQEEQFKKMIEEQMKAQEKKEPKKEEAPQEEAPQKAPAKPSGVVAA